MAELDATDWKILEIVQSDGRISNLDLADRIGLSPTPCSRRLKRLEEIGVIAGYGARIDPVRLGFDVSALITVRLSRQAPDDIETFLSAVDNLPEIVECLLVAGNIDYVLRVRVRHVEDLRDFILAGLKTISGVSETTTMLILQTDKLVEPLPSNGQSD